MRNALILLNVFLAAAVACSGQTSPSSNWKTQVDATMPLLGHRNWILVVDSAYPLQTSPGVETLETDADQLEVVASVLQSIHHSRHVRPLIYMDAELPFVPDEDAPGASTYRKQMGELLRAFPVESVAHEKMLANVAEAGKQFHILVLKTNMAIPYTSVFIRLDCKYWSAEQEKRLRAKMAESSPAP